MKLSHLINSALLSGDDAHVLSMSACIRCCICASGHEPEAGAGGDAPVTGVLVSDRSSWRRQRVTVVRLFMPMLSLADADAVVLRMEMCLSVPLYV